ncbi:MAG: helix-turn-helix transcriptional regulator [Rhodobacteraceae bacterium]|nr:helix-turn-helix transcriptional regulator [Paracoccaceae bacterium]
MNQPELKNQFLRRLKAHIDADENLNVSKLAVDADLSNSAIRLMFSRNAESVRLSTADAICKALGTTYKDFMEGAATPEEQEIVRLVSQLSAKERELLLTFGKGLVAAQDQSQPKSGEDG